jgi:hypothetical protein
LNCYDQTLRSPKCNGVLKEYTVQLNTSIQCMNDNGTCSYDTCMCDKLAAECFGKYADEMNNRFFNLAKKECQYESK